MSSLKNDDRPGLIRGKRILFNFILVSLPVILLLLAELFLRVISYGDRFRLFIDYPGEETQKHRIVNPEIGKKYFKRIDYSTPCHDMFLKEKPENGFRIFVLGSSTVLGFPYDENLMFSRILEERLQDSYPEKHVEVVNTAMTAINSFTLQDFMDDILKEKPDAILIYAGHNEFYGAMGIGSVEKAYASRGLTLLHLDLLSSRLYQLLRNVISGAGKLMAGNRSGDDIRGTLMKAIAGNKKIVYQSEIYLKGIRRYEKNMGRIMQRAKKDNVPVFISELVSNVKDLKPFCSSATEKYPSAMEKYFEGERYERNGDFVMAKKAYYDAKDLDCIRFRATEELNEVIHRLAKEYNAILVPMKTSFFEQASPHGLIGNNLITEHVHPNIEGYFLMADAFFYELAESKLPGEKLNIVCYKNSDYYRRNWGYTKLDSLLGVHRIKSLLYSWPFQPVDAPFIDYRIVYKPVSRIDSLAFEVIKSPDFRTYEAHLQMAEYCEKRRDFYNAFREYHAALKCNPFLVEDYLKAADCLMKTNDMALALKLLDRSLELQESFPAWFRKGEILLVKGDYDGSAEALEKARELDTGNENSESLLTRLYEAYYYKGDTAKYGEVLAALRKVSPDFQPRLPEKKTGFVFYIPVQVEAQIRKAIGFYNTGDDDTALDILLKTLEIKETSIANRIIGDILIRKNDRNAMVYYLKAWPDYQNDTGFLFDLGLLYLAYNQTGKAKEILEKMKQLDPGNQKTQILERRIPAMY
jgi:tetratricopeptide (TPR) repeat protein